MASQQLPHLRGALEYLSGLTEENIVDQLTRRDSVIENAQTELQAAMELGTAAGAHSEASSGAPARVEGPSIQEQLERLSLRVRDSDARYTKRDKQTQSRLEQTQSRLKQTQSRLEQTQSRLKQTQSRLKRLEQQVEDQGGVIAKRNKTIKANEKTISQNTQTIQNHGKRIDGLETQVQSQTAYNIEVGKAELRKALLSKIQSHLKKGDLRYQLRKAPTTNKDSQPSLIDQTNADDDFAANLSFKILDKHGLGWIWKKNQALLQQKSSARNEIVHREQTQHLFAAAMVQASDKQDKNMHLIDQYADVFRYVNGKTIRESASELKPLDETQD